MVTAPLESHVLREGTGRALVLLHGFPLDHRMWADAAAALPADGPVLVPDLPGLGATPVPDGTPSIDAAADAVATLLDGQGIERAVVAGLSMGGYVALALADRRPDLVAGLGLVDTKSTADGNDARQNRLRIADEVTRTRTVDAVRGMPQSLLGESSRAGRPDLVALLDTWIGDQRPAGVAWSQRAMAARPDRTHVLACLSVPVSVVVGSQDTVTPRSEAEHMVAAARDARLVVIDGVGHMSAVEDPGAVAEALAQLVTRCG